MSPIELVALILALVGPLLALAKLLGVPETLALFGAGLAAAFVPGLPPVQIDPDLLIKLFLPPILYAATVRVSFHLLRYTLLSGVLVGVVLALGTIAAVAGLAELLLPGLPWVATVLLGIVVAVFDTRLFHEAEGRPHVPRALADALKTREMLSRITALACFALTVDVLRGEPLTPMAALGAVAYELVVGAVVGAVIGRAVVWVRGRVEPAPIEIAVSIATPYLGALAAEALGVSMVAVVIASALVVSAVRIDTRSGAPHTSAEARISAMAFWEEASLILSAVLFFLTGWALPRAMAALETWPFWWLMGAAAALLAATVAIQSLVSFAAAALPGGADELGAERRSWRFRAAAAGAMAWASTRSVIGLVVALSIPATRPDGSAFAERDLILVLAALVILGSILLQGLTLRAVVRRAGLADPIESKEEAAAERVLADAMREGGFPQARRTLLERRARNHLGDETLRKLFRELDLRERAAEPSALPGAGPPNP